MNLFYFLNNCILHKCREALFSISSKANNKLYRDVRLCNRWYHTDSFLFVVSEVNGVYLVIAKLHRRASKFKMENCSSFVMLEQWEDTIRSGLLAHWPTRLAFRIERIKQSQHFQSQRFPRPYYAALSTIKNTTIFKVHQICPPQ